MPRPKLFGREQPPRIPTLQEQRIVAARVNSGMVTSIDAADIPDSALQLAKNAIVRFDITQRRPGSILLTPLKPNRQPVLKLAFIKKKNGLKYSIRMTPSTVHTRGRENWTSIHFATGLTGTVFDRFTTADILDRFIFANNGADPIQTIDFLTGEGGPLGNAPNYRYVFGFFNRAVGLALRGENEVQVGWSADGNALEWDPLVDESAGFSPILESPADLSDYIKGGVSFTNVAIILREKSVWHATKQPIAQNPFYFYSAVPGIGCDAPFSIQIIGDGRLAWLDVRTGSVYGYAPGSPPESISQQIENDLLNSIVDPEKVFAAYDARQKEYTIYAPQEDGVVVAWLYNFRTNAWTKNEYLGVVSSNDAEVAISGLTIDELEGTIDDLEGTIDELSGMELEFLARSYGRSDGSIAIEDETVDVDADFSIFVPVFGHPPQEIIAPIQYETEFRSKIFYLPDVDVNVSRILIEYLASRTTDLTLEYSKDNGNTWYLGKTIPVTVLNKPKSIILHRVIHARRFMWRLRFSSSDLRIMAYEVYVYPSGRSK